MSRYSELLKDISPEALRTEAAELQGEATRLLAIADALEGKVPESPPEMSRTAAAAKPPKNANGGAPKTSKRPRILEVVRSRPTPPWQPAEMRQAFLDQGWDDGSMSPEVFRVTMTRMADKDALVKTADGYTLPGHEPDRPEGLM